MTLLCSHRLPDHDPPEVHHRHRVQLCNIRVQRQPAGLHPRHLAVQRPAYSNHTGVQRGRVGVRQVQRSDHRLQAGAGGEEREAFRRGKILVQGEIMLAEDERRVER